MKYNGINASIKSFYDVNFDFLISSIKKFSKNHNIIDIKLSSAYLDEIGLYHFCLIIYEKGSANTIK